MPSTGVAPDEKGLSARQLVLVFLAGVAVCAVFFSLGFLVGYNERTSPTVPVVEPVTPTSVIPAPLNPPPAMASSVPQPSEPPTGVAVSGGSPDRFLSSSPPAGDVTTQAAASAGSTRRSEPVEKQPESRAPASSKPSSAASREVRVGFTIQVIASRTKQDAEALVKILGTRGYPVFLVTPEYAHASDNLYRVQVGPFGSREEAEKVRNKLTQEGFKPFIRH